MPKPTIGGIVHYHGKYPLEILAAIITNVIDADAGIVSLAVFHRDGHQVQGIQGIGRTPARPGEGYWAWPTRAPSRAEASRAFHDGQEHRQPAGIGTPKSRRKS